jgi:hypothetical protein
MKRSFRLNAWSGKTVSLRFQMQDCGRESAAGNLQSQIPPASILTDVTNQSTTNGGSPMMVTTGALFDKPSLVSLGKLGKPRTSCGSRNKDCGFQRAVANPLILVSQKILLAKSRLSLKSWTPRRFSSLQGCGRAQNICSLPGFGCLRMFVRRRGRTVHIAPDRRASPGGNWGRPRTQPH